MPSPGCSGTARKIPSYAPAPVPVDSCVFAVQVPAPELVDGVRRRANALIPFYAPLGLRHFSIDAVGDSVLVGALAQSAQPASEPLRTWGEPLPAQLTSPDALFE